MPNPEYSGIKSQDEKRIASQFFIYYHNCLNRKKDYPTIPELAKFSTLSTEELKAVANHLVEKGRAHFNGSGGLVLKGYEEWKYDLRGKLKEK